MPAPPLVPVVAGSVVQAVSTPPARAAAAMMRRALWAMSWFLSGRASYRAVPEGDGPGEGVAAQRWLSWAEAECAPTPDDRRAAERDTL
ncbi:hypothetical protein GCM10010299_73010 [Streptomyces tanashiensis]|nr:hypothetical protein GCM10010299_73010 [Streptomyces tanashiensis]